VQQVSRAAAEVHYRTGDAALRAARLAIEYLLAAQALEFHGES